MKEAIDQLRLLDRLARLSRERLAERVFYAKGTGAHGVFRPYLSMADYTKAEFLQDTEKETEVFVRFSTALGRRGSSDTVRDGRGFFTKFYTEDGNYDLLCSSIPVSPISALESVMDFIQAFQPQSDSDLLDKDDLWRFAAKHAESVPALLYLYSDRGMMKSYRCMESFSVFPYLWENKRGQKLLVKYYWKPLLSPKYITRQEAEFLGGFDPDAACRDLQETFQEKKNVEYELYAQLLPVSKIKILGFDPYEVTLRWPESLVPFTVLGKLTLTCGCCNHNQEAEKAAFAPGNTPCGISLLPLPLLRILDFACKDGHRYRLGAAYETLKINQCRREVDGQREEEGSVFKLEGVGTDSDAQDMRFLQAGAFYLGLSVFEQDRLSNNILDDMMFLPGAIQKKVLEHLEKVDVGLAKRIAKGLAF